MMVFWIGFSVLIGGAVLFGYGFATVQSLFVELRELYMPPFQAYSWLSGAPSPFQVLETRLFLVQFLQLAGLVMAVLGAVTLAYGLWVEKENK